MVLGVSKVVSDDVMSGKMSSSKSSLIEKMNFKQFD